MILFKKVKKGFTLIELVVVIAVIAILSAVSVVSYVSITNKAKQSSDQQKVDQLNLSLAAIEIPNKPSTMFDALEGLKEEGFVPEKFKAEAKNYEFAYMRSKNRFVILENGNKIIYPKNVSTSETWDIWKFTSDEEKLDSGYSHYLLKGFTSDGALEIDAGIDVGENAGISSINYTNNNSAQNDVVIRTNSQFTNLTVDGKSDHISHYGVGNFLTIVNVAPTSFHENGSWQKITLNDNDGKLVIESSSFVGEIVKNGGILINNGVIVKEISGTDASTGVTNNGTAGINTSSIIRAGNSETLMNLAMAQSTGVFGDTSLKIELTADIDLTGKTWVPFGAEFENTHVVYTGSTYTAAYPFQGTLNGNHHMIIGFSNGSYDEMAFSSTNTHTSITGYKYGLIATVKGDVTVKNISFKNLDINAQNAKNCAAVIGNTTGVNNLTLENINILSGTIKSKDKAAGLIGYMEEKLNGVFQSCTIKNCKVNASLVAENGGYRAGGLIGYISFSGNSAKVVNIIDCTFSGSVVANEGVSGNELGDAWIGAIASGISFSNTTLNVKNFTMSGIANESDRKWGATANLSGQYMNEKNSYLMTNNGQILVGLFNANYFTCDDSSVGVQTNIPWSSVNVVESSKPESNYREGYNTKVTLAANVNSFTIVASPIPTVISYVGE